MLPRVQNPISINFVVFFDSTLEYLLFTKNVMYIRYIIMHHCKNELTTQWLPQLLLYSNYVTIFRTT